MKNLSRLEYCFDDLTNSLNQIDAMLTVAMSVDATEIKHEIVLNYLSAINDITQKAKKDLDRLFASLPKNT